MPVEDFLQINNLKVVFEKEKREDGLVLALFSQDGKDYTKDISKHISDSKIRNIVVAYTKKAFSLNGELLDYEIIQDIKNSSFLTENEVLQKELNVMEEDLEGNLKKYLNDNLGTRSIDLVIYHDGKEWVAQEKGILEKAVDASCSAIYTKALPINNELINKQNITTAPIKKARKTIIEKILKKELDDEGFVNGTGPESTIFRAVIKNTGIEEAEKREETKQLLDLFTKYVDSCVNNKISLKVLTDKYYSAPYGMRAGVLPIILSYVISYRNGDIVIYKGESEVEANSESIIAMCDNPDEYSLYISKEDALKEDYLKNLIETFDPDCYASLTGTRITNVYTCMQRWYRSLPQIAKNIKNANNITGKVEYIDSIPKLRTILQRADGNAYESVFITIPEICNSTGDLKNTNRNIKAIKGFLDSYYDKVLDYLVNETLKIFNSKSKHDLIHTLSEWYEKQSDSAKNSLSDNKITAFMNSIKELNTFDEKEAVQKIAKTVSGLYVDSWNDNTISEYLANLIILKGKVEEIKDDTQEGRQQLTFTDSKGNLQKKYFEKTSDSSACILKNIISDSLEDFSGLSVNDKVAVLVEMLENVINKDI